MNFAVACYLLLTQSFDGGTANVLLVTARQHKQLNMITDELSTFLAGLLLSKTKAIWRTGCTAEKCISTCHSHERYRTASSTAASYVIETSYPPHHYKLSTALCGLELANQGNIIYNC